MNLVTDHNWMMEFHGFYLVIQYLSLDMELTEKQERLTGLLEITIARDGEMVDTF